ncbi:periplasmic binding protein [Chthoniobacter flavus Ellin428]|uniref:Periplasmic binding protein n=1 Tax=Chthoniobacter flavus Ellin428 TaxID=497964 RepID=B4D3I7_9BACT|nr:ABC transporter substrate-binding protein [Chthoniobacter flavus]EDY18817.1 periplasmic binding protein [Chthoniobacter flavus Ellin428]TCO93415.1 iron complex transport system substrate-binding protein [Chthoniobacter flavus]
MRIVCLSAEAADVCARLGAWDDVLAVSAFASQAGLAPRPVIGGFSTTDCDRVAALRPDLVICFSDVQAEIAAQLIRRGCTVLTTNQRTLAEIAEAIRLIGRAIGHVADAERLAAEFLEELEALEETDPASKPRVYFEEWPDPLISGIAWVGELIERCGGVDVFATRRGRASTERRVTPAEVIAANPDIIIASWCGKRVDIDAIRSRPGFAKIRAVQDKQIHAIDSDLLLQPGPRVLEGAREFCRILNAWRACLLVPPNSP